MSCLLRWVENELQSFLKLLIPNAKLLKDGIESQENHGEGNVKAKVNRPKTNQVLVTKVEQGNKENLPNINEVPTTKVEQVEQGERPNLPKTNLILIAKVS